jgi:hypothetical protein
VYHAAVKPIEGVIAVPKARIFQYLTIFCVFAAGAAHAQTTRTWVSGEGDDANPCSLANPCKTFAGAISKTTAGGEIDVLTPGAFGVVTISKALTIDGGGGQISSLQQAGTNGVTVTAGAGDVVTLRNLQFQGLAQAGTPGLNGIQLNSAKSLHIERCTIQNFSQHGINVATSAATQVFVDDTVSRGNTENGLNIVAASVEVRVSVSNSHFADNAIGIFSGDFSTTTVRNTAASGNSVSGFAASGAGGSATMTLVDSTSTNNLTNGISAGGGAASAQIRMSNVNIIGNPAGLVIGSNGTIVSFGNNHNTGSGAPSSTLLPQ